LLLHQTLVLVLVPRLPLLAMVLLLPSLVVVLLQDPMQGCEQAALECRRHERKGVGAGPGGEDHPQHGS
jgi:hypothetical protein